MPRDEQERAARGEGARRAAAENQAQAAGRFSGQLPPTGFVPGGQALSRDPLKVQVVNEPLRVQIFNGNEDFFTALRRALGLDGGAMPGRTGAEQLRTQLGSPDAITQAASQIAQDVKTVVNMMRTLQMSNMQLNVQISQTLSQLTSNQQMITDSIVNGVGGGGAIPGGGHGGHGGHGHGQPMMGYTTGGSYVSYGSLAQRGRAALANAINAGYGTSSPIPKHYNPQALKQHMAQRQFYGQVAGGVAHGGIIGGMRRLPYVGMGIAAVEGVNDTAKWLAEQSDYNSRYQAIYNEGKIGDFGQFTSALGFGGENITGGLANRVAEEGYVLGQRFSWGGMTGDKARAAFQGVSALGYTGAARNQNLDFISQSYRGMGMDPSQGLQYAQVSAQYAMTNLNSLYESLTRVSQAARVTGQSADSLRQVFMGNYQGALAGGAGGGAVGLAQAMTLAQSAGGRALAGQSQAGLLTDTVSKYAMSAFMGTTPAMLQGQAASGNYLPMAQAMTRTSQMYLSAGLGPNGQAKMQQLMQQYGGQAQVAQSPGTQQQIAVDLMNSGMIDEQTVRAMAAQAGFPSDNSIPLETVLQNYVNYAAGNTPSAAAQQQTAAARVSQSSPDEANRGKSQFAPGWGGLSWGTPGAYQDFGKGMTDWTAQQLGEAQNQQEGFEESMGNVSLFGWHPFGTEHADAANNRVDTVKAYADYQKRYGQNGGVAVDSAIQSLITQFGNDPNMRIRVRTKNGDRAVTLKEAIQYYPDQLSTGAAYVMSSDPNVNGKQLKTLQGFTPSLSAGSLLPGEQDTTQSTDEHGEKADDAQKRFNAAANPQQATDTGGTQTVTIDLAPGAAQTLLRVVGSSAPNARPPDLTSGVN